MKSIILAAFCCLLTIHLSAQTIINGKINTTGSVEVFISKTPMHLKGDKVGEYEISESGDFEIFIDIIESRNIKLKISGASRSLRITPGSTVQLELSLNPLRRRSRLDPTHFLKVISYESSDSTDRALQEFSNQMIAIRSRHSKYGSQKHVEEVANYLSTLNKAGDLDKKTLYNSMHYINALEVLSEGDQTLYEEYYSYFTDHFSYNYDGFTAIQRLHTRDARMEYLVRQMKKMKYFDFVDDYLTGIDNDRIRKAVELDFIASAVGRKWADQTDAMSRLQNFIDTTKDPQLQKYAVDFMESQMNKLIGSSVRDFQFTGVDDSAISISQYKGDYLLLDFWATWCGPCVKSMRKLPALKSSLQTKLNVLCITTEANTEKVKAFVNRNNFDGLHIATSDQDEEISTYFHKRAIPLYYLVDPSGKIIDKAVADPIPMIKKHLK